MTTSSITANESMNLTKVNSWSTGPEGLQQLQSQDAQNRLHEDHKPLGNASCSTAQAASLFWAQFVSLTIAGPKAKLLCCLSCVARLLPNGLWSSLQLVLGILALPTASNVREHSG